MVPARSYAIHAPQIPAQEIHAHSMSTRGPCDGPNEVPLKFLTIIFAITMTLALQSSAAGFPLSGRQYDAYCMPMESALIREIYQRWLDLYNVSAIDPSGARSITSPSSILHMMLATGGGRGLTQSDRDYIQAIDTAVIHRAGLVLQSIRKKTIH